MDTVLDTTGQPLLQAKVELPSVAVSRATEAALCGGDCVSESASTVGPFPHPTADSRVQLLSYFVFGP